MLWWLQLLGGYEARGDARASRVTAPHPLHQGLSVPYVHPDHHSAAHDDIGRECGQNPGEVIRRYCTPWIAVGNEGHYKTRCSICIASYIHTHSLYTCHQGVFVSEEIGGHNVMAVAITNAVLDGMENWKGSLAGTP